MSHTLALHKWQDGIIKTFLFLYRNLTSVFVLVHQVVLTISQMMWCRDVEACLEGDHDHFVALQEFEQTNFDVNHINYSTTCLVPNCLVRY